MGILVTEAERTIEGARDRFRRVTQGALEELQQTVLKTPGLPNTQAFTKVSDICWDAAVEYKETAMALRRSAPPPTDIADLSYEDP